MKNKFTVLAVAFVLAVFALDYYFLKPRSEVLRDKIAAGYSMMLKDEQFVRGSASIEKDIKSVSQDVKDLEKRLVPEKSEFLAAAKLQGDVSDLAEKAGLRVLTIRPLASSKVGGYSSIPVYFEGNCSIKQMSEFVRLLEADNLMIRIDKLGLNITNMQNPTDLKFKIQVSGLVKL